MPIIRRWWISSNSLSLTRHKWNLITGRSDPARYLLSLEHELWLFARVTKKGPPDLFVVCLATKNVRKILFSTRFTAVFFCFFIYYLSHANSAIISATCSIFSHRHAFSPQNSSASSVSPFAACTSALVIQYGVFAGLQVAIH